VSQFSPYITHGVITIDEIVKISLQRHTIEQAEMRYKELLRREYFTQVHYRKGDDIFDDMEEDKTTITKQKILPIQVQTKTFAAGRVNQCILQLEST
jgi:deoxyribodipyrimidine photolyase